METQIYDRIKNSFLQIYKNKLNIRSKQISSITNHCFNQTNNIKQCLRNKKLSVINNLNSWERECLSDGFYRNCVGQQQKQMVQILWQDEMNSKIFTKQGVLKYDNINSNTHQKANLWL